MREIFAVLVGTALLAGCSKGEENVVFITATQLDIGYDASIGNLNVGYDRNELMIGPAYVETGGLPPVAAALRSNLSIMEPKVSQVYATGNAAIIATAQQVPPESDVAGSCATPPAPPGHWVGCSNDLRGKRAVAVFGTSSNFGLKVGFDATGATSVSLGYKRREVSVIPLAPGNDRDETRPDDYPSVLGSIEIDNTVSNPQGTKSELAQFFATGRAAEQLAMRGEVRSAFGDIADQAAKAEQLNAYNLLGEQNRTTAESEAAAVARCVDASGGTFDADARGRVAALVAAAGITDPNAKAAFLGADSAAALETALTDLYGNQRPAMVAAVKGGSVTCAR